MRRLIFAAVMAACILSPSCKKKETPKLVEEGGAQLLSVINVADPKASVQLIRGFYDTESNAWRWTNGKFAVVLKTPNDRTRPAKLTLDFALPDPVFSKTGPVNIAVSVNGKAIGSQKFSAAGTQKLELEVPATELAADVVNVDFSMDKFLAAGQIESRELGVVVSTIGLQ